MGKMYGKYAVDNIDMIYQMLNLFQKCLRPMAMKCVCMCQIRELNRLVQKKYTYIAHALQICLFCMDSLL